MSKYNVNLRWDSEAGVWIATGTNFPGLVLESESCDVLIERVRHAIPDLLGLDYKNIPIHFTADRYEKAYT